MRKEERLSAVMTYVKTCLKADRTGHDWPHIERVLRAGRAIAKRLPQADEEMVEVACLVHDVIDDKVVADVEKSKAALRAFLEDLGYDQPFVHQVFQIITRMSYSYQLDHPEEVLSLEGQIVRDADRLDAIGTIAIARVFIFGGSRGDILYDPAIKPQTFTDKASYRRAQSTMINHFYEKLLKLKDLLHTDYARELAQKRQAKMEAFLADFLEEWEGADLD